MHGTKYPWFVGKSNQSRGCIRMKNKDANDLYSYIPMNTLVKISHNKKKFRNLYSGDVGSDVFEIQMCLKDMKYFAGHADGKFGDILRSAVIKFQSGNGLDASGNVNKSTYDKIIEMHGIWKELD